jgi:hypothetical protein
MDFKNLRKNQTKPELRLLFVISQKIGFLFFVISISGYFENIEVGPDTLNK